MVFPKRIFAVRAVCRAGAFLAALTAVGLSASTGCAKSGASQNKPVLVFAVDVSHSTDQQREEQLNELDLATARACVDGSTLCVWVFADKPAQVWSGVPNRTSALTEIKAKYMGCGKPGDKTRHITRPGALLKALVNERRLADRPMHLFIASDGDSDDYNDLPIFTAAARTLATRPGFKLFVLGIDPANRLQWDKAFSACPTRNVSLVGVAQAQQTITDGLR